MIYFYAGLGAAMLTGIMALFDLGLALTVQPLREEQSDLEIYQDVVNSADQLFQRMLTQPSDLQALGTGNFGAVLCQQIFCRIHGTGCRSGNMKKPLYVGLKNYSMPNSMPPSGVWSSSCVLQRQLDTGASTHRILIRPSRESLNLGYELYSCIVEQNSIDQRCLFERGA